MTEPEKGAYSRDFTLLFLVMLIIGAGNTALQSMLPGIGRSLGVADSIIATIFSVSALIWVFSAPYWAARSDRRGRKQMVLTGAAGFTVSIALVGAILLSGLNGLLSPTMTMIAVLGARSIYGSFGSAAPPAAQAMVALRTSREERTKALTMLGSAFGLGTIIGPAVAPYLIIPGIGLAGPALSFAVLGLIAWLAAAKFLKDEGPSDGARNDARGANISYPSIGGAPAGASATAATAKPIDAKLEMRDPRIWPWMLAGLITGHAQAMTGAAMGFLVIDRLQLHAAALETQQSIGLVFIAGAAAALLVQWGVIPNLRIKPPLMMLIGLIIAAVGMCGTANADSLYTIATTFALSSIGFGFTRPAFTAGSSLAVGRRLQGLVAGRVTSVNGASYVLGPTLGVGMYELWHPLPFIISALILTAMIPYSRSRLETAV